MIIEQKFDEKGIPTETLYGITGTQFGTINTILADLSSVARILERAQEANDWQRVADMVQAIRRDVQNIHNIEDKVIE